MIIRLRMLEHQLNQIRQDLARPHRFAAERVGFLTCGAASLTEPGILLLAEAWHSVADEDYVENPRVGACIAGGAFRKVFQAVYRAPAAVLHIHQHDHVGPPRFSLTDERSMREFVPGFFNVCPSRPHGAVVLSRNSAIGAIWTAANGQRHPLATLNVIGQPSHKWKLT